VHRVTSSQALIHSPSTVSFQHVSFGPTTSPPAATLTEQRQRRLDMVSRAHNTSVSFSRQPTTDDEEDPYAWLSRTAPPSPRFFI
jgi:hypothetical protein